MTGRVPLDRALSKLGVASRAAAKRLIADGLVTVDGRVITSSLVLVSPERQTIRVDGVRAERQSRRLIAFHKPRGVVTTRSDPEGRKTVFDVLGDAAAGLHAVGRLDLASTGLLLLTNDTRLSHELTDPANAVSRSYVVTVRGLVDPANAERITEGLNVPTHSRAQASTRERLRAAAVQIRKASHKETHLIVELTEGKNREIRRLFEAVGHEVTRVHRIAFGSYELGELQPGQWREEAIATAVLSRVSAATARRTASRDKAR